MREGQQRSPPRGAPATGGGITPRPKRVRTGASRATLGRRRRRRPMVQTISDGQTALLERIARGEPLAKSLHGVIELIEGHADGLLCSVLLVDCKRGTVHPIAAPSLPADYTSSLEGAAIGPKAGSCGTAAFRG